MFKFKIFSSQSERYVTKIGPTIDLINSLEPEIQKLSDAALRDKTGEFRQKVMKACESVKPDLEDLAGQYGQATSQDEKDKLKVRMKELRNSIFEDVLAPAFAVVREAGRRTINMRHFDVQLVGGLVLHEGKIAEMATGEGKTLVATLPVYLNALSGQGVHVVTVNDYLARRDRNWMGPIYEFLGLSIGVIQHDMPQDERKKSYACDVTYGTNNEFGFDYLRDNMVINKDDMVQRRLHYAIVDEVDSILIDEARTPLIISGPAEESVDKYYIVNKIIPKLKGKKVTDKDEIDAKYQGINIEEGFDYLLNEKTKTANLTERGVSNCEKMLGVNNLYDDIQSEWAHHIKQALSAHGHYEKDVDYVVKDGEVLIVDEFTGRLMPGRRWSDGLHQAIEAKEGVKIERENQTLATITFQNYFRMYDKLAGMTGTAETEAGEFKKIYNLDVIVIPTNRPLIRSNFPDVIYKTEKEKFEAVCLEIAEMNKIARPVLVGTVSIEKSERLSNMLKRLNIPHHVLNAKYHEMEAEIVSKAGQPYAVTIATNMAGRGTDIVLGEGIAQKGGLHVVGTERHEARRIDNQLRGRSGRQGDPGSSRFYLSLNDDLMRIFGSDKLKLVMDRLGLEDGQDIQHPWVTKAIATAQKRVEDYNFEIRKHLLEYDNVMNKQREIIYTERRMVLESDDLKEYIFSLAEDTVDSVVDRYFIREGDSWDSFGFKEWLKSAFAVHDAGIDFDSEDKDTIKDRVIEKLKALYEAKQKSLEAPFFKQFEKYIILHVMDTKWKDHLYSMDNMREGIGLRAYGQRDPLIEYQHEAYNMFEDMISRIKEECIEILLKVQTIKEEKRTGVFESRASQMLHPDALTVRDIPAEEQGYDRSRAMPGASAQEPAKIETYKREEPKVGRNDPCPCGSGKKYKKCCGR